MARIISEWFQLRKFERNLTVLVRQQRIYRQSKEYRELKGDDLQRAEHEILYEWRDASDPIEELKTRRLVRQANRLDVPVRYGSSDEERDRLWEDSVYGEPRHHLTAEGYHKLRSEVRAEIRDRREHWLLWWTPLVSIIVALLSLVIALVNSLRR